MSHNMNLHIVRGKKITPLKLKDRHKESSEKRRRRKKKKAKKGGGGL